MLRKSHSSHATVTSAQFGQDRAEQRVELGADIGDYTNDHGGDQAGDHAVFNGGRAFFVAQEIDNGVFHVEPYIGG